MWSGRARARLVTSSSCTGICKFAHSLLSSTLMDLATSLMGTSSLETTVEITESAPSGDLYQLSNSRDTQLEFELLALLALTHD